MRVRRRAVRATGGRRRARRHAGPGAGAAGAAARPRRRAGRHRATRVRLRPGVREAGFGCWWAAPMFASDGVAMLGGVGLLLPDMREPHPVEEQILVAAGSLAAIAVERDTAQARLRHQASHDALTGSSQPRPLVERLREITESGEARGHAAVFFLDLDRFKVFNDSVGHDAGDRILVELGQRLARRAARRRRRGAVRRRRVRRRVRRPRRRRSEVIAVAQRLLLSWSVRSSSTTPSLVVSASVGVARVDGRPPERAASRRRRGDVPRQGPRSRPGRGLRRRVASMGRRAGCRSSASCGAPSTSASSRCTTSR